MKLSDFEYPLPKRLIAQRPASPRDTSRLMVVNNDFEHRRFHNITEYLQKGDVLVVNDTRVIPARLTGHKPTGGKVKALLIGEVRGPPNTWECFLQAKKIHPGLEISFNSATAEVVERGEDGKWILQFNTPPLKLMEQIGEMPLPPYIKTKLENPLRYQTVYAAQQGSVAAPTAGLHFTDQLLTKIQKMGVKIERITLHVGPGTFLPVRVEDISAHRMHAEHVTVTRRAADEINNRTGRLVAVGTTTLRSLEAASLDGTVTPYSGWCDLFIYPPYAFQSPTDALITNFHLPGSTLLMLVSAFAGREKIMNAYNTAIEQDYRFYSFGDAMLLFKEENHV